MTVGLSLPVGQHLWESAFRADDQGRPLAPRHHRLLIGSVPRRPTDDDAEQLEQALARIDAAYPHGPDGLFVCVGWGPGWFDRWSSVPSPIPAAVAMSRWEDPELQDLDLCIHLASDHERYVESVTADLFPGGVGTRFAAVRLDEIRSGFVGAGLPAERLPGVGIAADAPLFFGFRSGLRRNQASESRITIPDGPFAGGTTMHLSRIDLDVEGWYRLDADARAARMYAPRVTAADADGFVDDAPSDADDLPRSVREHGLVGHAQAAGRGRVDDAPSINRRDFATVDDGRPGTHFVALQRHPRDFQATRATMNGAEAGDHSPAVGPRHRNGINAFMEVRQRANLLVPPRRLRTFPYRQTAGADR